MATDLKSKSEVDAFIKGTTPSVVHFYASWAPSCQQVNELLKDLLEEYPLRFATLDAEEVAAVTASFKVSAAPTLLFFSNGKEVARVDGYNPALIKEKTVLTTQLQESVAAGDGNDINKRLKSLINQSKVMLFMKGNKEQPRCGFSRQIIALLGEKKIDFKTFDILNDNEVREGLKTYSNWPTYPQLYVDGELIGGLDVVKEELEDEEFVKKLPKVENLNERLEALIKSHRLMLFMKGDPETPKCGFSRTIVGLLNDARAEYGTFDILTDDAVRQGLKEYSNWPTYPQLYLDGELVGGLDIVKEELLDTSFLRKIPRHRS